MTFPDASGDWILKQYADAVESRLRLWEIAGRSIDPPPAPSAAMEHFLRASTHAPAEMWLDIVSGPPPQVPKVVDAWIATRGIDWTRRATDRYTLVGEAVQEAILQWFEIQAMASEREGKGDESRTWQLVLSRVAPFGDGARGWIRNAGFALAAAKEIAPSDVESIVAPFEDLLPWGSLSE